MPGRGGDDDEQRQNFRIVSYDLRFLVPGHLNSVHYSFSG